MSVVNRSAIDFNYQCALTDVECQVNEVGLELTFESIIESDLRRDKYRSVQRNIDVPTSRTLTVYAYPAIFSPNTKQIEKAGLFEPSDIIVYTPMKTWIDASFTFDNLDLIRWDVVVNDAVYHIEEKTRYGQLGSDYLYVVFGLTKK